MGDGVLYRLVRCVARIALFLLFRPRFCGLHHVPARGAVMLTPNHLHWLDAVVLAAASSRPVSFMAKQELFRTPLLAWVFSRLRAFPVQRGRADRRAVRNSLQLLGAGEVLAMFPEGTRSKDGRLQTPELGVALIALKTSAVVVPVAIHGPYRLLRRLRVDFCAPVDLAPYRDGGSSSETLWQASVDIMSPIAARLGQPLPTRGG